MTTPEYTWKSVLLSDMTREQLLAAAQEMGDLIAALTNKAAPVLAQQPGKFADPRAIAKMRGYVGEACPDCMNFTLVRNGTCLRCDTCGSTTGCS